MKTAIPFAMLLLTFSTGLAQRNFDDVEIKTEKITDNIYVLFGAGGNIGLAIGEQAAYLIDDQYAPLSEKITAAVREVTDKPLKFLVNTHWHGDHTGGNINFGKAGTILIAHENVRERLGKPSERNGRVREASPEVALPEITFSDELTLHLGGGQSMHVMHVNDAHTDGDSYIYFPEANVIHMGDNFANGGFPFIDLNSGGDIEGFIKNLNMALFIVDDQTRIIPGHGPVTNRETLRAYRDMLETLRNRVKAAQDSGNSLEQTLAMGLSKEWDADFGTGFINNEGIITAIYRSLE
ncbi:MBL fold metallo-hydrolase [Robiginitalea aurantiaca]|uniref:MBL fold metallo-hydrolase n=1 Tax=Robiginitalea aurantiaca TaxID=3056915 RepID=A0ABT7WC45_9FLAO|nr:MBL fold metallo-hydrolase [Robiginitalea aurantiaca]MDM9630492.1 MBL fold metallo-hydrolase [Robiginitalea aurantiaca]